MDSIKKYMKEKESQLSVEEVEDKVWERISRGLPQPRPFGRVFTMWRFPVPLTANTNRKARFHLAMALTLVLAVVAGSGFKVDSSAKQGDLLLLTVDKKKSLLWNQSTAGLLRSFTSLPDPRDPRAFLFIKFNATGHPPDISQLRSMPGYMKLEAFSIRTAFRESLVAAAMHRYLNFRITKPKASKAALERAIGQQLKKEGIDMVRVVVDGGGLTVVFSPAARTGTPQPVLATAEKSLPPAAKTNVQEAGLAPPEEKQFLITGDTRAEELEAVERTVAQLGYTLQLDTIAFAGKTLVRLAGFLTNKAGRQSNKFDASHFKSLRIIVNHRGRNGDFSLEITNPTQPYSTPEK